MKKYFFLILLSSSLTVISFSQEPRKPTSEQVDMMINKIVETYQKRLPFQVDEMIEFSNISYDNKTVKYTYTVTVKPNQLNKEVVYKNVRTLTCNPNGKTYPLLKNYDISYEYSYYDKENNLLTNFVIDKSQCQ